MFIKINSYIPPCKATVTPKGDGGITAHATGHSPSYTRTHKEIISWELSDRAAGWQTIVDLPKGTGKHLREGLLAERCVPHSPSSRLHYKEQRSRYQNGRLTHT